MDINDPRLIRVAMVGDSLYARRDAVPAANWSLRDRARQIDIADGVDGVRLCAGLSWR
jgi:hypothetical protein